MQSWEIIATYRHAWALAQFAPSSYLAKALGQLGERRAARIGTAGRVASGDTSAAQHVKGRVMEQDDMAEATSAGLHLVN